MLVGCNQTIICHSIILPTEQFMLGLFNSFSSKIIVCQSMVMMYLHPRDLPICGRLVFAEVSKAPEL